MATRKRKTSSRSGGTWLGLILGMVLGVGAAVAVALFVTQAPMPFMDKASRSTPSTLLPDVSNAPDPNIGLYGKDGPAGTRSPAQGGGTNNPPAPAPSESGNPLADDIGKLIAGLDAKPSAVPPPSAPPAATAASGTASGAQAPAPPPTKPAAQPAPGTQTIYYLQTGAFRSKDEAEAMRARVLLLGLPVRIEQGQSNGSAINRVRVGPFKGIDEMNRARTQLGSEKIESSVVRP
ncbi:SPOR domain-containing protein [Castellaniella sp. GW247-6E4]|uniref:SPOR domain-containing protein n=1 Tax=Castellaniella sp. GW247-6E4 TaxID=3140380 RepID=UPI0033160253